jgi:transposase-like protein
MGREMNDGKPGRKCSICLSSKRKAVEAAIVKGFSNRAIARRYDVSASAIFRHKAHVARSLAKASERREINLGDTLLDRLAALEDDFRRLAEKAEACGEWGPAALAVREARETLRLINEMRQQEQGSPGAVEIGFKYGGKEEVAILEEANRVLIGKLMKDDPPRPKPQITDVIDAEIVPEKEKPN